MNNYKGGKNNVTDIPKYEDGISESKNDYYDEVSDGDTKKFDQQNLVENTLDRRPSTLNNNELVEQGKKLNNEVRESILKRQSFLADQNFKIEDA